MQEIAYCLGNTCERPERPQGPGLEPQRRRRRTTPQVALPAAQLAATSVDAYAQRAASSTPSCLLPSVTVYTDGSFATEPSGQGFAGSGVWFQGDPTRNISSPLPGRLQTNNRAELYAVLLALWNIEANCFLTIFSDSQYVVKGVNLWLPRWRLTSFRTVSNADLWREIEKEVAKRGGKCAIRWVPGHQGNEGNEGADQLANFAREAHPGKSTSPASASASLPPVTV